MIVVDASAVIDLLLNSPAGPAIARRLFTGRDSLHAPHLLDMEVAHALRRGVISGHLEADRGREALDDLIGLPVTRHPHDVLLLRIWELRHNMTPYDAAYVALAEALDARLVTRDAALAAARGHRAQIELF